MAERRSYGTTQDGKPVEQFTLRNKNGLEVRCINYGCRLTNIFMPQKGGGESVDVLLGFDTLAGYEADLGSYQGAFVGRYANRIAGAAFELEGNTYHLTANDRGNFLHGCYSHRVFDAEATGDNSLAFTYLSPDGEEGFPGELQVSVLYTLTEENELVLDYRAVTSAPTYVNLTNHSYFNLTGQPGSEIYSHALTLNSIQMLESNENQCPTGRVLDVAGGAFDFSKEKPVGQDIGKDDPQLKTGGGYDHCFILDKLRPKALTFAATLRDPASGRSISIHTTQPAIQLYSGNHLDGTPGKGGVPLAWRTGLCLETQYYPDSPHQPDFPSTLLLPGERFHEVSVWAFEW